MKKLTVTEREKIISDALETPEAHKIMAEEMVKPIHTGITKKSLESMDFQIYLNLHYDKADVDRYQKLFRMVRQND